VKVYTLNVDFPPTPTPQLRQLCWHITFRQQADLKPIEIAMSSDTLSSSAGRLDHLVRRKQDLASTRDKEDHLLAQARKETDDMLERYKASGISGWTEKRNSRLEQHKAKWTSSLVALKTRHAQELVEFQKRQADEVFALERRNTSEEAEMEKGFSTSRTKCLENYQKLREERSKSRKSMDDHLKRKRVAEDAQLNTDVLWAFEEMALPKPAKNHSGTDISNYSSAVKDTASVGTPNSCKRRKLDREEAAPGCSSSSALSSTPLSEEWGLFRLRAIQITNVGAPKAAWYSAALASPKTYRWNADLRVFEHYNGKQMEAEGHLGLVNNIQLGLAIYFHRSIPRIAKLIGGRWFCVEFWNYKELDKFKEFCKLCFENILFYASTIFQGPDSYKS
jgi:protein-tyrosine-phosphatase